LEHVLLLSLTAEGQHIAGALSAARRIRLAGVLEAILLERSDEIAGALGLLVEAIDASRQDERRTASVTRTPKVLTWRPARKG
jgi:hypothetical protein